MTDQLDLGFLDEGASHRRRESRRRGRAAISISAAVTAVWLIYVTGWGHWDRVSDRWVAALTMVFGSFVAGSTPQGGGAVAFPVFTKVLDIPAPVARTFSLCVQAVGMGTAALSIAITRRQVAWRAVAVATPISIVAFVMSATLLGQANDPFWAATLPGSYVKMTFTLVIAALAVVVYLGWRLPVRQLSPQLPAGNARATAALVIAGVTGGVASALVGSGADVLMYLCVVVLFGLHARVGVPTSIIPMAALSVTGLVLFGVIDGQLSVELSGELVTSVGGHPTELPADRFDLFGLWLAATPVVCWGAPLGSYVASRVKERHLVTFILALALVEVVSTLIFLNELHRSVALMVYSTTMALLIVGGLGWLSQNRHRVFNLPPFDPNETLRRNDLDVAPNYISKLTALRRRKSKE